MTLPKIHFDNRSVPFALLLLLSLSFGLLVSRLGFYWDDWSSIWFYHQFGPAGVAEAYSVDRPALGWLFFLTTSLLGESTLAWQIFGVLTRWLCCLAFWWFLRALWPQKTTQLIWITLLFAIYPGFKQQYIAVTYSHDWLIMAGFFVSLGLSIWAIRKPRWFWPMMVGSWLLAAYALFADEYYFGLELLRPLFLWMVVGEIESNPRRRITRSLLYWLPYLIIVILFLIWRIFIHISPRGQLMIFDLLQTNPTAGILALVRTVFADVVESSILAWRQVFIQPNYDFLGVVYSRLYWVVILVCFVLSWFFLARLERRSEIEGQEANRWVWPRQAILVGGLALLVGGIPFWMTDLPITLQFSWDRFTLPMMFGTSILLVGLVELIPGLYQLKVIAISVLIALAAGLHLQNAYSYRYEWVAQKSFFWQLSWRIPGLKPNTTLLTAEWPFVYYSDFTLTAPLNWMYDPDNRSHEMSYLLYTLESRLGTWLKDLEKGIPIEQSYRTLNFSGTTSQALGIYYTPPACLRVIDPRTDKNIAKQPAYFQELLPLSDPNLIAINPDQPAVPPPEVFGPEPEPDWCYYYEKADLARQRGDWQEAASLGDQAMSHTARLVPRNAPEYVPYIEAYAMTGQWEKAREMTIKSLKLAPAMEITLCETWSKLEVQAPGASQQAEAIIALQDKIGCKVE